MAVTNSIARLAISRRNSGASIITRMLIAYSDIKGDSKLSSSLLLGI